MTKIKSFFAEQVKKHQKHIAFLLGVNLWLEKGQEIKEKLDKI